MVRQSRSGRLQWVAGVSGRVKINRYAMAVRASPSRLQSTLCPVYFYVAVWCSRAIW